MAARVIWKGSVSFGLVHVPVALYSAEQRSETHLSMLDRRDLSPVGYKRVNKTTGAEVPWEDVVKGYEYDKGQYVVLEDEDLERANVKATQTVEIAGFTDLADIPFMYFDKPYYLEPINKGEKVYALLRESLKRRKKAGIAKVVLRSRQYLAALVAQGDMLVLELLRYEHELRDPVQFSVPGHDLEALGIRPKELEMAERLVDDMSTAWDPSQYRDEYRDDLLALIEEKAGAGEVRARSGVEEVPRGAEVIDLMSLLKRSVQEKGKKGAGGKSGKASAKKKAKKKTSSRSGGKRASR